MLQEIRQLLCRNSVLSVLTLMLTVTCCFQNAVLAQQSGKKNLNQSFEKAAKEFEVPADLLRAIAYAETRFDDHQGSPSVSNGYGVMHLVNNPRTQTLPLAAGLLGASEETLMKDVRENIRGGAAVLRLYADQEGLDEETRTDLAAWYPVVARYGSGEDRTAARLYADDVFKLLNQGFSGTTPNGETIMVVAKTVEFRRGRYESGILDRSLDYQPPIDDKLETDSNGWITTQSTDYGPALWVPARYDHYRVASRPSSHAITHIIIHTTEGTYASAISWFRDPSNPFKTSAHYVIRSRDGEITQMVREKDIAHHIGGWNNFTIGIEHEAFVAQPSWYTDVMYRRSAELTRNLVAKYGIPINRDRIRGHSEVPGATHTDPGPYWDWNYYMQLLNSSSGWSMIVGNTTAGRFTASANWGTSDWNTQRYGTDYRYAEPAPVSDAAWYKFPVPATDNYEVYVWYPASSGYNSATPIVIETTGGIRFVRVNQQVNGGQWVSLGVHNIAGGDRNVVGVSRWSDAPGLVIADAVRLVRR